MKIVGIFVPALFSFQYEGEPFNEYERLMDLWTDASYLFDFAKNNGFDDKIKRIAFVRQIQEDAEFIQDLMEDLEQETEVLSDFFRNLKNLESNFKELSFQKGRPNRSYLRLYAIRIDIETYVITGGAIKLTRTMDEHPDTRQEKVKLNNAKFFLKKHGVFDKDSFEDYTNEEEL